MEVRARSAASIAAVLLLVGCGGNGSSGAGPGAGSAQTGTATTVDDGRPFACPAPDAVTATPGLVRLPRGANSAQICAVDNGLAWLPPQGRLTRGVRELVHLVNTRPVRRTRPSQVCNADLGPAYAILLRYDDGVRTVTADTSGCRFISVGSSVRSGGRTLFHAFLTALARQRAHTTPAPARRLRLHRCVSDRVPPYSPLSDPTLLADARLCPQRAGSGPAYARHGRPLDTAQLRALRHDLATAGPRTFEPKPGHHYCRAPVITGPVRITAIDRWGDEFVLGISCDTYQYTPRRGSRLVMVHLLPATARLLAQR